MSTKKTTTKKTMSKGEAQAKAAKAAKTKQENKENAVIKVTYFKDSTANDITNNVLDAVRYERFSILITELEESIARLNKDIKDLENSKISNPLNNDAKEQNISIKRQIDGLNEKVKTKKKKITEYTTRLSTLQPVYDKVINTIASASNEHITNNINAVRNLFRLTAVAHKPSLHKYIITDEYDVTTIKQAMDAIHSTKKDEFDENGRRKKANKELYQQASHDIKDVTYKLFSVPVESEYIKAVKIKLNNIDLGMLHEVYSKEIKSEYANNSNLDYKGLYVSNMFKETKNGIDASKFNIALCRLAMNKISILKLDKNEKDTTK